MTDTYTPVLTRDEIAAQWYAPLMADDTEAFARRIERATIEAHQRQQWRPIETAPCGQLALFYDANATEVRHCMFVDWFVDGAFCGNRHHTATHWQPLPPPPEQS